MSVTINSLMNACRAHSSDTSIRAAVSLSISALMTFIVLALRSCTVRSVSMIALRPSLVTPAVISPAVRSFVTSVGLIAPFASTSSR